MNGTLTCLAWAALAVPPVSGAVWGRRARYTPEEREAHRTLQKKRKVERLRRKAGRR